MTWDKDIMAADSEEPTAPKAKLRIRDDDALPRSRQSGKSRKHRAPKRGWFSFERLGQFLLAILLVGTPWWYGSVSAMPQFIAAAILLVCLVIWSIKSFSQRENYRPHIITFLVFLFLILGLLQQVPLPEFATSQLANRQNEIRGTLAEHLDGQHSELSSELKAQTQVAINLPAANYQFSFFCIAAAAFLLGSRFFHRRGDLLGLAIIVAFNGGVLAVFGAFQKVSDPNQIFGETLKFGGTPYGPFVNRNNASGYLLMCLACSLAVMVHSFSTIQARNGEHSSGLSSEGFWSRLFFELRTMVAGLDAVRVGLLALSGCIVLGIGMSLSRGGLLALAVGFLCFIGYLLRMKSWRGTLLLTIFLVPVTAAMLIGSGLQESIGERIETLQEDDLLDKELRIVLWKDSLHSVQDYPIIGSGVGSFPYIYKEYQTFPDGLWCFHAENIFVEILVTFGVLGASVMLIGLCVSLLFSFSLPLSGLESAHPSPRSIAIGGLGFFVLVTQSFSNFFDFGLFVPANGLLFAVLIGALTGAWCVRIEHDKRKHPRRLSRLPKWTSVGMVPVVAGLTVMAGLSFWYIHLTESANLFSRSNDVSKWTKKDVSERIERLEAVLDGRPNLETHEYLGRLYVLRLQHAFTDQQMEALADTPNLSREEVWDSNSLRMLNFQLAGMSEADRKTNLDRLLNLDSTRRDIDAATSHFLRALATCPLSVRSLIGLAELSYFNGKNAAPYFAALKNYNIQKPEHLVRIGNAAVSHGRTEVAIQTWRSAIEKSNELVNVVIPTASFFLSPEQVVDELLPDDSELLDRIAEQYFSSPGNEIQRESIYRRVARILEGSKYLDVETYRRLAKAHLEIGEIIEGIEAYEQASRLKPNDLELKSLLAHLYYQVGRRKEAVEEIRQCLNAKPDNIKFQQKLKLYQE